MGKKIKIGKQRRDKYYRLAKEAGLRSRAVFKLSQLNRKFEFLQKSQVLVDLCAAPGGWLQVASKYMPMSSLIIGVDLVPIKAMPNVITIADDITKESCRAAVKKELKSFLADCVLNDGAPNVGKNWGHDAFMQAQLTLSAMRLATEILRRGGWFITKIFRSKDHPALIEVFKKLFKKVYVTKPDASRSESAEIYVVCQGFIKPEKIDAELIDPKIVFKDANLEPEKPKLNLMKPDKTTKRKAEGYAEGDNTLYHRISAKEFFDSVAHLDLLADTNQILIDDDVINKHPATTDEIRECCRDIKVLGRKELRELLNWRKKLRHYFKSLEPKIPKNAESNEVEEEEDEEIVLDRKVAEAKADEKRSVKKKRKKDMKEKRKKKQRLDLQMIIPGDQPDNPEESDLFNLRAIKKQKEAAENDEKLSSDESDVDSDDYNSDIEFDEVGDFPTTLTKKKKGEKLSELATQAPMLVDFDDDDENEGQTKTDKWFQKDIFADLLNEEDEDAEIEQVVAKTKHQPKPQKESTEDEAKDEISTETSTQEEQTVSYDSALGVDQDSDGELGVKSSGFEVVPADKPVTHLGAEGLALAEMWIHSSKTRRDLMDFAYHRYTNNDDNLPDWFTQDEKKHWRKQLPVTKEAIEENKRRLKEINARPIKKVAEAKFRKRKRALKRLEKARAKSESVVENADMTEKQKSQEVKKIYKKYTSATNKKPEVKYVVAKKGQAAKRVRRPAGVSGRFKVVDPRLKKDLRKMKSSSKKSGSSSKKGGAKSSKKIGGMKSSSKKGGGKRGK